MGRDPGRRVSVALALASWILGAAVWTPAAAAETGFQVIVHPEVAGTSIDRAALSAVFLKKALRWVDGTLALPIDQSAQAPVREAFSQRVHGQPLAGVMRFWMRQIADGRSVPPPVKESDADVFAYVASKRGAVGYVTAEAPIPSSVRVIQIPD